MRKFLLFLLTFTTASLANTLDYALIKKGEPSENTMLLIGGIQGDEPGGFLAASIVATDYNITKGSLWVVPNLNFPSIIERSRGTKGDMNRKFAHVDKNDPDYAMQEMLKQMGQGANAPKVKPILEINADHEIFAKLEKNEAMVYDIAPLLLDMARLNEGMSLENPAKFSELLTKVMIKAI